MTKEKLEMHVTAIMPIIMDKNFSPDEKYNQILRVCDLYARSKWNQACEEQKALCDAELVELTGTHSEAPKPEFKP